VAAHLVRHRANAAVCSSICAEFWAGALVCRVHLLRRDGLQPSNKFCIRIANADTLENRNA